MTTDSLLLEDPTPIDQEVRCLHDDRVLAWDFVDYSDTPGWVHDDDGEALCRLNDPKSPQAEPF